MKFRKQLNPALCFLIWLEKWRKFNKQGMPLEPEQTYWKIQYKFCIWKWGIKN